MIYFLKRYIEPIFLRPKEIFLNNLGLRQIIIKNTFWLALAEGISRVLHFFLFIYIARILGALEYGKFTFALAFSAIFLVFGDFGIFKILTREFSKDSQKEKDFSALFSLKIFLSLGAFLLLFVSSFFITQDYLTRKIILILGLMQLMGVFLNFFYAFFRARQKMEYQALFEIIKSFLITCFGFFVLLKFPSALNLGWGYMLAVLISLVLVLIFFNLKAFPLRLKLDTSVWKKYLAMSYPIALAVFLGSLYANIDSSLMGLLGQITQTGWYNAAQKIAQAPNIFVAIIGLSFYPVLSRLFVQNKEILQKSWNAYLETIIFIVVPMVFGGIALASRIIYFLYSPDFFPSILALQILISAMGIGALQTPFGQYLVISDLQKKTLFITAIGGVVNVVFNLILIPQFSLYGAAFASLLAFVTTFFFNVRFCLINGGIKFFNFKIICVFLVAVFSSLLMCFTILQIRIHILWQIFFGFLVYLFWFFVLKIIVKYARVFIKMV